MYLVTVTNVRRGTCHLYVVSGENSIQCALDACREHQRVYGGDDEDLRMNEVKLPARVDGPVEVMKLD